MKVQNFILSVVLLVAGFVISGVAQSAPAIKQKCPTTSLYASIQITSVGDEISTPCASKTIYLSGDSQIGYTTANATALTKQFGLGVLPSSTVGVATIGDCITTPTTCIKLTQSTDTIQLGNATTATGVTVLDITGVKTVNLDRTITPALTVGAQTINKQAGTVNFAAGAAAVVVTNSTAGANSITTAIIRTTDATCVSVKSVVPASGSFTINLNTTCTAETSVGFVVWN